jgi:hypothetical protein
MSRASGRISRTLPTVSILAFVLAGAAAMPALGSPGGYTGRTATTSGGCGSCHGTLSGTTAVVLTGPATLAPGAVCS